MPGCTLTVEGALFECGRVGRQLTVSVHGARGLMDKVPGKTVLSGLPLAAQYRDKLTLPGSLLKYELFLAEFS